ncbi:TonB-dependent receptor [Rickettsiales bacterium]|nr:TonB-dependent receptor [Rickettsiales bacterium]
MGRFNNNWSAKLMYGQAFRQPYPAELYLNIPMSVFGNPNLKAEKISTFEGQITYRNMKMEANLGIFKSILEDTIEINPVTKIYRNGEDVDSYGIEFDMRYKLTESVSFDMSFLSQRNENDAGVKDRYGTPNLMLKTGVNYSADNGFTIGVFNTYMDASSYNKDALKVNPDPNEVSLLSANIDIDLPRFLNAGNMPESSFSLYFNNILDEDHVTYSTVNTINTNIIQSGREVYGKLTVKF